MRSASLASFDVSKSLTKSKSDTGRLLPKSVEHFLHFSEIMKLRYFSENPQKNGNSTRMWSVLKSLSEMHSGKCRQCGIQTFGKKCQFLAKPKFYKNNVIRLWFK